MTSEAEKEVLGISHGEIGAIVLKRFSVPQEICEAVKFHDTPNDALPDITDSQLAYISRAAGRIVGKFTLPAEKNPLELNSLLSETIAAGKSKQRQRVREEIRSRGYADIFPELLADAANLVSADLKQYLPERTEQEDGASSAAAGVS